VKVVRLIYNSQQWWRLQPTGRYLVRESVKDETHSIHHFSSKDVSTICQKHVLLNKYEDYFLSIFLLSRGYKLILLIQWLRGLRRGSAATRLLGLRVRIPPGGWMSVSCDCCVLSGRVLCFGLITRPEKSYRVWCVWVLSRNLNDQEG
jgi:hypothetical protein